MVFTIEIVNHPPDFSFISVSLQEIYHYIPGAIDEEEIDCILKLQYTDTLQRKSNGGECQLNVR